MPEKNPGIKLPEEKLKLLQKISKNLNGCWDVFLWKGSKVLFVELKRIKKDKIRDSQIKFYKTALGLGIKKKAFLVVEWDIIKK